MYTNFAKSDVVGCISFLPANQNINLNTFTKQFLIEDQEWNKEKEKKKTFVNIEYGFIWNVTHFND